MRRLVLALALPLLLLLGCSDDDGGTEEGTATTEADGGEGSGDEGSGEAGDSASGEASAEAQEAADTFLEGLEVDEEASTCLALRLDEELDSEQITSVGEATGPGDVDDATLETITTGLDDCVPLEVVAGDVISSFLVSAGLADDPDVATCFTEDYPGGTGQLLIGFAQVGEASEGDPDAAVEQVPEGFFEALDVCVDPAVVADAVVAGAGPGSFGQVGVANPSQEQLDCLAAAIEGEFTFGELARLGAASPDQAEPPAEVQELLTGAAEGCANGG